MSRDMRDWEIDRCQDKIMKLEAHIGECEIRLRDLRNLKIKLEDENEELLKELKKYKQAAGRVI